MLRRLALTAVVPLAVLATAVPASTATASGPAASGPVPSAVPTSGPFAAARPALGPLPMPLPRCPGSWTAGRGRGPVRRTRHGRGSPCGWRTPGSPGPTARSSWSAGPPGAPTPEGRAACDRLAEAGATRAGRQELFRETPEGTMCTMIHGGDAFARIVGTWEGRAVDTTATRRDGCEIARWNSLVPVLPDVR
ncbi:hypothetical protein SBADM41S_03039 [Streptomyces badius]